MSSTTKKRSFYQSWSVFGNTFGWGHINATFIIALDFTSRKDYNEDVLGGTEMITGV
jgi:hypothetical protein